MAYVYALDPLVPDNTDLVSQGAPAIREFKSAVIERLNSFFVDADTNPLTAKNGAATGRLTVAGGTVTTSQPALTITQTWNAGAVVFTGISFDVTNTASDVGSLLVNLKVGGVSKWSVDRTGAVIQTAALTVASGGIDVTGVSTVRSALTVTAQLNAQDLLPRTNNTYTLGSAALQWSDFRVVVMTASGKATFAATGEAITVNGGGTGQSYQHLISTGGDLIVGLNGASSLLVAGTSAYATCILTNNATDLVLATNGAARIVIGSAGGVTFSSGITIAANTLITTTISFSNGAGVGAGTLTNAPANGNPTKWIPVNDNGVTRYLPSW